jgi:hypothetical protein
MLDGAGLGSPFELPVEFELDAPDLGEADTLIMREREATRLWIGEAIIAVASLKPGIARVLPTFDPTKERLECLPHRFFCPSTERLSVSLVTPPVVDRA